MDYEHRSGDVTKRGIEKKQAGTKKISSYPVTDNC